MDNSVHDGRVLRDSVKMYDNCVLRKVLAVKTTFQKSLRHALENNSPSALLFLSPSSL